LGTQRNRATLTLTGLRQTGSTHRAEGPPPSGSLDRIAIGIALDGSDEDDGKVTVLVNTKDAIECH
jgi:hypothetical protein